MLHVIFVGSDAFRCLLQNSGINFRNIQTQLLNFMLHQNFKLLAGQTVDVQLQFQEVAFGKIAELLWEIQKLKQIG